MAFFSGKLQRCVNKEGKEWFKGKIGGIPMIAFWGVKNPDNLYVTIDHKKISFLAKRKSLKVEGASVELSEFEQEIDKETENSKHAQSTSPEVQQ